MRSIVLTGGGTAGHVMPNVALLPLLRTNFEKIYYIGTKNGIEKEILKKEKDVTFIEIEAVKFIRKFTLKNLAIPFKLISSIKKCKNILKTINPNIVFSKGGFVSVPVCISAKKLGIPVISHESDFSVGLANKIIYRYSTKFLTSFPSTKEGGKKVICTGIPLRQNLINGKKSNVLKLFNADIGKQNLLVFGGSLGAKQINNLVFDSIDELTKKYNVVHIVGKGNINSQIKIENYLQVEFVSNMEDFYAFADMCICRSGATTIFELLELKKPMLLLPLSKKESRGDQIQNAQYMQNNLTAIVLLKDEIKKTDFLNAITNLDKKQTKLFERIKKTQKKNSLEQVFQIIKKESIDRI